MGGMLPRTGEWRVKGDEMGLPADGIQVGEHRLALPLLAGRVVEQHTHAQLAAGCGHLAPHIAHTHDTDGHILQIETMLVCQQQKGGGDVLLYGGGVAARSGAPSDVVAVAPCGVDMVVADGSGADQLYAASCEDLLSEVGHRAHDQCILVAYRLTGELVARQVLHLAELFGNASQVGDVCVGQYP